MVKMLTPSLVNGKCKDLLWTVKNEPSETTTLFTALRMGTLEHLMAIGKLDNFSIKMLFILFLNHQGVDNLDIT